ncbi:hypothetical protein [Burkholderia gladioli]|uniref:hypothetical protein n=1 Tax=Burkholderia gladioli TaxID=28095 RepID=UPI001F14E1F6|nr:hypothetical protein [Burkholderia gladioli]
MSQKITLRAASPLDVPFLLRLRKLSRFSGERARWVFTVKTVRRVYNNKSTKKNNQNQIPAAPFSPPCWASQQTNALGPQIVRAIPC